MEKNYNFKDISVNNLEELSKYNTEIYNHALILSEGDKEVAHDGVQNMYLNIHKYMEKNPGVTVTEQLISLSLRNCIRNIWKVENRSVTMDNQPEGSYNMEEFDEERENKYETFISELSSDLKQRLSYYSRYKTREIAQMENKTIQQVRDEKREFKTEIHCLYTNKQ